MCNRIFSGPQGSQPTDAWSRRRGRHGKNAGRGHILGTVLLLLLLCAPAWGAPVTPGATTSLGDADGCTINTDCTLGPFSVPAGSNRLAIVSTFVRSTWTSETATLGGVSLSSINRSLAGTAGSNVLRTWCLLEEDFPSTGDQNLVIGGSASVTSWSAIVTFYTNAAQTCPITNETAGDDSTAVSSVSSALTPVATGSILQHVIGIASNRDSTLAATSPQVIPANGKIVTNSRSHAISTDVLDVTTEATAEFTWTSDAAPFWSAFIIEAVEEAFTVEYSSAGIFFKRKRSKGPFRIQPLTLTDAEEETAYTGETPLVSGGEAPYTWGLLSGAAPRGISIEGGGCE